MNKTIHYSFLILIVFNFGLTHQRPELPKTAEIPIIWVDSISGDFSFTEKWDYPEGVYRNKYGQLSCDGYCPRGADLMKDDSGRIYKDSLAAFYNLVDTSHLFYTIECDAWCYECAGTNYASARRLNKDSILCRTHVNVGTHCSLNLMITKDICYPTIRLNSIRSSRGIIKYNCTEGKIEIDKNLYKKGILKAKFDFTFYHSERPGKTMYWRGLIYTKIEND